MAINRMPNQMAMLRAMMAARNGQFRRQAPQPQSQAPTTPMKLIGQKLNLPGFGEATVQGIENFQNTPGFWINTDKGKALYYDQDYVSKGAVFDNNQYYTPQLLDAIKKNNVAQIDLSLFDDAPTATTSGRAIGQNGYLFTDKDIVEAYPTTFGIGSGINPFTGITTDEQGNLRYIGQSGDRKNGYYTYEDPTQGIVTENYSSSGGKSLLGKVFGSAGEKVASSVRDVLGNKAVQVALGVINPAIPAALSFGNSLGSGAPIGDSLKGAAKSYALNQALSGVAGGINSGVSSSIGGTAGNIAGQAATGAFRGGVGSLVNGGDFRQGLLSGGFSGGLFGTGNALGNYFSSNPTSFNLDQGLSGGLDGVAGDLGNNYGDYVGGLDGIAGDIGADYLGSTGRGVNLANFLATLNGDVAPGRMNATPYSMINPLTGKERQNGVRLKLPSKSTGGLLAGGAALGRLLGSNQQNRPEPQFLPINRYGLNASRQSYEDELAQYGLGNLDGFKFYKSNIGLLG